MRIVFTWRPKEWRELYLLTTAEPQRRAAAAPGMGYVVAAVMALGGVGEVVHTLHESQTAGLRGTLMPALLGLAVLLGAVVLLVRMWRARQRLRGLPAVPMGEQQVVLQETGWKTGPAVAGGAEVHPWSELQGQRRSDNVLALVTRDGAIAGFPLRAMGDEQAGSIHRLLIRKLALPLP